jgi:hypothetical protein
MDDGTREAKRRRTEAPPSVFSAVARPIRRKDEAPPSSSTERVLAEDAMIPHFTRHMDNGTAYSFLTAMQGMRANRYEGRSAFKRRPLGGNDGEEMELDVSNRGGWGSETETKVGRRQPGQPEGPQHAHFDAKFHSFIDPAHDPQHSTFRSSMSTLGSRPAVPRRSGGPPGSDENGKRFFKTSANLHTLHGKMTKMAVDKQSSVDAFDPQFLIRDGEKFRTVQRHNRGDESQRTKEFFDNTKALNVSTKKNYTLAQDETLDGVPNSRIRKQGVDEESVRRDLNSEESRRAYLKERVLDGREDFIDAPEKEAAYWERREQSKLK